MKKISDLSLEDIKEKFEDLGYFPNEKIVTETILALKKLGGRKSRGQAIWSMCLDGPSGAGKSSFVENYVKLASEYLGERIEFLDYECNDTTGKSELYEEVGMVAVVLKDAENIIIPGVVVEAIRLVNEGKKVVLLLDEFDKSRTETDVFFYKFLQSGKINTVQLGNLEIKPEYMSNLQVFFCKNDFRELSDPLYRRSRNLLLDYMKPELFNTIANRVFLGDKEGVSSLINLVTLIYDFAYNNVNMFKRLPACSELLIAIEDAYDLTGLNVESNQIYNLIFSRLFKSKDDLDSFEGLIMKTDDEEYKSFRTVLSELKDSDKIMSFKELTELLAENILDEAVTSKTAELDKLIEENKEKIRIKEEELNKKLEKAEEQQALLFQERMNLRRGVDEKTDKTKISLSQGNLIREEKDVLPLSNFNDSTDIIRRGQDIFNVDKCADWTIVGSISFDKDVHEFVSSKLVSNSDKLGIVVYENGILLNNDTIKLVLICESQENNTIYKFYSSAPVIPSIYLNTVRAFTSYFQYLLDSAESKVVTKGVVSLNTLIYNDTELVLDKIRENIYVLFLEKYDSQGLKNQINAFDLKCDDKSKVLEACISIMDDNSKKLVAE